MSWKDIISKDMEKRISLTGNRCENPNCMARVENEGDVCDKCKMEMEKQ